MFVKGAPGALCTGGYQYLRNVFPQDLANRRAVWLLRKMTEVPVKFQSNMILFTLNLIASRLYEILQ